MQYQNMSPRMAFNHLLSYERPSAAARITGNVTNPRLSGLVKFYQTPYDGILIEAEIFNLPNVSENASSSFYGMHIHQYGDCSDNFEKTGSHYNPTNKEHPYHAGDLLPLLGNQGYAWMAFYDKRFHMEDIIGKSVVIHDMRDDFTTQPSGDSGTKIGCGEIRRVI